MDCTREGAGGLEWDSDKRKGRKMMMEWNGVVAMGMKKMRRKYVERIDDRFMGDKLGERDRVDLPGFQCKLGK